VGLLAYAADVLLTGLLVACLWGEAATETEQRALGVLAILLLAFTVLGRAFEAPGADATSARGMETSREPAASVRD
jgi:hypothetical protein